MYHLSPIDDALRPAHRYLTRDDVCLYLLEYHPRRFDAVKQILMDFKKRPNRRWAPDFMYKALATWKIAAMLGEAIPAAACPEAILIPIPPSKSHRDPLYDDRMDRLLRLFGRTRPQLIVQQVISVSQTAEPAHEAVRRPRPEQILKNLRLDVRRTGGPETVRLEKGKIILVDDVLTTGAHFKACQQLLKNAFPRATISGLFIARRVPWW